MAPKAPRKANPELPPPPPSIADDLELVQSLSQVFQSFIQLESKSCNKECR